MRTTNILGRSGFIHGCDYNPEQWEDEADVWESDLRLMKAAGVNTVALGIFAWSRLEPKEGLYDLDWMEGLLDRLHENGIAVWLATPSGAKPHWLALAYPEVRRCQPTGDRDPQANRQNHCPTSPIFREKVRRINEQLASRFGRHAAVTLWHISNEYGGACYCPLCFRAFQQWLESKYGTVDRMNRAWWTRFWSHHYDSFEQVTCIDGSVSGLFLDWQRFVSDQTANFMAAEVAAVRPFSDRPATTNLMGFYPELDSRRLARVCDVIGWDAYPDWHGKFRCSSGEEQRPFVGLPGDALVASELAFLHDLHRGLQSGRPWLLMESSPSHVQWRGASRLKEPGVNRLAGLQAVAHGSDSVAYFQWRAGRGGAEAFHGSVVGHIGHGDTRVFREITGLSADLAALAPLAGTRVDAQAAILYDWEVRWHLDLNKQPRNADKDYPGTCVQHYRPLWKRSIACDIIGNEASFEGYRLLIAPALYMLRPGQAQKLEQFVEGGGILLCTAPTGVVDHNDLAFPNGRPGPLRALLGLWVEEMDVAEEGSVDLVEGEGLGLTLAGLRGGSVCELFHEEGCEVLATYANNWYAGRPALTRHRHGRGWAFYLGTRGSPDLLDALIPWLAGVAGIESVLRDLPDPVTAHTRGGRVFLFNWGREERQVDFSFRAKDLLDKGNIVSRVYLPAWGASVLEFCT